MCPERFAATCRRRGASGATPAAGGGESGIRNSGFVFLDHAFRARRSTGGSTTRCSRLDRFSRFDVLFARRLLCPRRSRRLPRRRAPAIAVSIPAPTRSIRRSHDIPVNSDQPMANSAISTNVAPLNPSAVANDRPIHSPSAPPALVGNEMGSRYRRSASSAELESKSRKNPGTASHG